ncbi:hypothetical protein PIB30_082182 [Stylosanthes scabra]|uniref:Uncharacterized protein n=1 Tax=Stylosanthes scabra TaxID=79078 RepID=A0ABU6TRF7_9FABA|nr:hypothetical protein [Stylosanthes scabra]
MGTIPTSPWYYLYDTVYLPFSIIRKLSARKVLPELVIEVNDEILSPCAIQIKMRKWEKFTNPLQAVGHNMVKEFYTNWISGPKYRGRAQGKLKRTREARRMDKKPKRAQLSVDRAPAPSRWRARALLSLICKFPLVARPRDPDGAPAPPHFVTPKTRTSCACTAMTELT